MRIISGKYRSARIRVPASFRARPTTDSAKEALFNILANYLDFKGLSVLDLFAGTGNMSLEFASRGAKSVETVEIDRKHAVFIERTVHRLGIETVRVVRSDAWHVIRNPASQYDIVFADPPYDMKAIDELPPVILENNLLAPGGWFILEHGRGYDFSPLPRFFMQRKYGSVHFSMFVNN